MDCKKIGILICSFGKERHLTQRQLADSINIQKTNGCIFRRKLLLFFLTKVRNRTIIAWYDFGLFGGAYENNCIPGYETV